MESGIAHMNRAPDTLKLKCRCYDSRDGHFVAFPRQVAQSALGRITARPVWNGSPFKMSYGNRDGLIPPASLLRNRRRAAPAHGRTRALASSRAGGSTARFPWTLWTKIRWASSRESPVFSIIEGTICSAPRSTTRCATLIQMPSPRPSSKSSRALCKSIAAVGLPSLNLAWDCATVS